MFVYRQYNIENTLKISLENSQIFSLNCFLWKIHWSIVFCETFYWLVCEKNCTCAFTKQVGGLFYLFFCLERKHDFSEICVLAWWLPHSFLRISPWIHVRLMSNKKCYNLHCILNVIMYFNDKVHIKKTTKTCNISYFYMFKNN